MSAKRLCAAFYISVREGGPAIADLTSLEKIAREAGVVDLEDVNTAERERCGTGAMTGHWDGIPDQVVVDLERLSEHLLFEICFFRSSFLSLLPDDTTDRPVEEDPAVVLAYAFRDACQRLRPDVAFLVTRPPRRISLSGISLSSCGSRSTGFWARMPTCSPPRTSACST